MGARLRWNAILVAGLAAALFGAQAKAVTINQFPLPAAISYPIGIASGPDGNLWFTEQKGDKIGRITTAGVITEFTIPTVPYGSGPIGIASGPDGNLWFTEGTSSGNKIGRITTAGVITEFPIPTASSGSQCIASGPDGNLWFTEWVGNRIGVLVPPPACSDANTLCLFGNRFQVTAQYDTYGAPNTFVPAAATSISDNTGYFTTVTAGNVDVVVKLVNFFPTSWSAYIGGTTDLGVHIIITDTNTGHVYTASNPLGNRWLLVRDQAFSCP